MFSLPGPWGPNGDPSTRVNNIDLFSRNGEAQVTGIITLVDGSPFGPQGPGKMNKKYPPFLY